MKQIHIWAAVVCLLLASCSDIRFGDDFLGDHPESSGATLDEMFSSAVNADRVLTQSVYLFALWFADRRSSL